MSLEPPTDIDTPQAVAQDFSEVEAHRWLKDVRVAQEDICAAQETQCDRIIVGYERRAWLALGYEDWAALCAGELQLPPMKLPQRREHVAALREAGLSQRAIASAVGTSKNTVGRDLAGVPNGTVDEDKRITGIDGKEYPARRQSERSLDECEDVIENGLDAAMDVLDALEATEWLREVSSKRHTIDLIVGLIEREDFGDLLTEEIRQRIAEVEDLFDPTNGEAHMEALLDSRIGEPR